MLEELRVYQIQWRDSEKPEVRVDAGSTTMMGTNLHTNNIVAMSAEDAIKYAARYFARFHLISINPWTSDKFVWVDRKVFEDVDRR